MSEPDGAPGGEQRRPTAGSPGAAPHAERSRGPIVAIDGPAGSGKSTVAREVARRLGVPHLDTGAFYRALALAVLRAGVDPGDADACAEVAQRVEIVQRDGRVFLDGEDVTEAIRSPEVTAVVSTVAAHPQVRALMLERQRAAAAGGAVVEGRDIGTVVFPDADLKVFLTAALEERARRRAAEQGREDVSAVAEELSQRDRLDAERETAPLVAAPDAWVLDTTDLEPEEVAEGILAELARPRPTDVLGRLPRVVVTGRPNVGKSTLVNRIVGARRAIVEPRPGVTRDRTEHLVRWGDRTFVVVDTGGWEAHPEGLSAQVVAQAESALAEADLALLVVDTTVGVMEDDEREARELRRRGIPTLVVANKVDGESRAPEAAAFYALGLGDPIPISARYGRGVADLLDRVAAALPPVDVPLAGLDVARIAIIGRPNVGKSSLFNALVGEERSIVDDRPHTTRDTVDTLVELEGSPWLFVDTAGLRRRYRRGDVTERASIDRARRAIAAADIAVLVLDASQPLGEQDQRLAGMALEAGCGLVLALNKWDLVGEERRAALERELRTLLGFVDWAPRVNVSARTGRGIRRLVPQLRTVWESTRRRIPTAELNRWLAEVTARTPPPRYRGRTRAIRYATQVSVRPPTVVLFTNAPLPAPYLRYLERELRERYGFVGVPIRFEVRARDRARR